MKRIVTAVIVLEDADDISEAWAKAGELVDSVGHSADFANDEFAVTVRSLTA